MRPIDADALIISDEECVNTICRDCKMQINGCADFFDIIENATTIEPEPQWIPCSERLPEDDTEVFVYLFDRPSPFIAWIEDCHWYTEEFEVEKDNYPLAWLPLPEPYKEKDNERA